MPSNQNGLMALFMCAEIYNAQGQLLMRTTNENIESLNLPQGVYILRKVGETQSYSIKFIK